MNMLHWAEQGRLHDWMVRFGIRRLLRKRLKDEIAEQRGDALLQQLRSSPMTLAVDEANAQHYEVPAGFFQLVLGPRLKYSCSLFEPGDDLAAAEERALRATCTRAQLRDGQRILELGCGWGSLTLWMAEQYPNSEIVAVSNSNSQREFILSQAAVRGLDNVQVTTSDIAEYSPPGEFDRVVSVEMFEHVRNHAVLMERIHRWLRPDGKLFVHIFCHREFAYLFEDQGPNDWMAREFFTGGMMPSYDLLPQQVGPLTLEERWKVSGVHYQQTSEAWLSTLDANANEAAELLTAAGCEDTVVAVQRWRMFFMACAELFGYEQGQQWHVAHYRFGK